MNNVDELLERFFNALENDNERPNHEDKISSILSSSLIRRRETLYRCPFFLILSSKYVMVENPKNTFSNEQEKLDEYLKKRTKLDNPD